MWLSSLADYCYEISCTFAFTGAANRSPELKTSRPILIVDDDPFILEFLKAVLEASDYPVVTASNGKEALQLLKSTQPSLILLDMAMPILDGPGFLREIGHNPQPRSPVVVMTAMDDARRMARDLGAEGWLQKPFDLDTLLDLVNHLLH